VVDDPFLLLRQLAIPVGDRPQKWRSKMPYIVLGTVAGALKPVEFRLDEVGRALTQAGILLKSGASDVSIHDQRGHHIEGPALVNCCQTGRIRGDLQPW
jgi:hypothetical protein